MLPIIALVGRANVGKSTLFNALTGTRDALVASIAGLTRDRQYGEIIINDRPCLLIDTGGLTYEKNDLNPLIDAQVEAALVEADVILLLVDAKVGLHPFDEKIAKRLRELGKPCSVVVNKVDRQDEALACSEFYGLLGSPIAIAAAHRRGLADLKEIVAKHLPMPVLQTEILNDEDDTSIRVAVVGRPNVGKSTLINRLLGEDRVIVFDAPGTTRDSICLPFKRDEQDYTLIDTAGVRRKYKTGEAIEHFSVAKSMQAIQLANVIILVIDARSNVVDQDLHLLGYILESGKALIITVNKWDGLSSYDKQRVLSELDRRLRFIDFLKPRMISALHGTGVGDLFKQINKVYQAAMCDLSTVKLTRILEQAVLSHQPPLVRGRRVKLRYAHAGGHNPPTVVIHGKQTAALPEAYLRYLANTFRQALGVEGSPVRIVMRTDDNPFAGRKNKLTPRQQKKRQRMMKHVKKKK